MNKILELSKKIHTAGFKPDMIYSEHEADDLKQWLIYPEKDFCEDGMSVYTPYFTADWCWKVLPKNIFKESYEYQLTIAATCNGDCFVKYSRYSPHFNELRYTLVHNYEHQALVFSTSLHEALLEMVYWCIEHEFLKGDK